MATTVLNRLLNNLKNTANPHKRKITAVAILAIVFALAWKKLKTHHVINGVMFFFRMSSRLVAILPTPIFASYRQVLPFSYQKQESMPNLIKAMNTSEIIAKIKKNKPGAVEELVLCTMSGVVLNLVVYNAQSLIELIKNKYYADFDSLGAASIFQSAILQMRQKFSSSLLNLRNIVTSQLHQKIKAININEVVGLQRIRSIFSELIDWIFLEHDDIREKHWQKRKSGEGSQEYKVADHLFRSTKQMIRQKQGKTNKVTKSIFQVFKLPFRIIGKIFQQPEEELTPLRYECNQFLYVLSLKQLRIREEWPNLQSKYLFQLVTDELIGWFSSVNFSIVARKTAEFNLNLFMNRMEIYFNKKKINLSVKKQPLKVLLSVFYRICDEEIVNQSSREKFYEKQLYNAFKNMKVGQKSNQIETYHMRNNILLQIYQKNQLQHLDRDMQVKFFNERDQIMINPVPKNTRASEEDNDIQQLLQQYQMTKQNDKREPNQAVRGLINSTVAPVQRMVSQINQENRN